MYTPTRTLYWRAMRRVQRRAHLRWQLWAASDGTRAGQDPALHADTLLAQAVRLANRLALLVED